MRGPAVGAAMEGTTSVSKMAILKQKMIEYEKRAKKTAVHNARMEDLRPPV